MHTTSNLRDTNPFRCLEGMHRMFLLCDFRNSLARTFYCQDAKDDADQSTSCKRICPTIQSHGTDSLP
jgi:hypothetical protein